MADIVKPRNRYRLDAIDRSEDFTRLSTEIRITGWELQDILESAFQKGVAAGQAIGQAISASQSNGYRFAVDNAIAIVKQAEVPR